MSPSAEQALLNACDSGDHAKAIKLLAACKTHPDSIFDEFGRTPLMLACRWKHKACAQELIKAGSDPSRPSPNGKRAVDMCEAAFFEELQFRPAHPKKNAELPHAPTLSSIASLALRLRSKPQSAGCAPARSQADNFHALRYIQETLGFLPAAAAADLLEACALCSATGPELAEAAAALALAGPCQDPSEARALLQKDLSQAAIGLMLIAQFADLEACLSKKRSSKL